MLGINSQIKQQEDLNNISIILTQKQEKMGSLTNDCDYSLANKKNNVDNQQKIIFLKNSLKQINAKQQQLSVKMNKCIGVLESELLQRSEENEKLYETIKKVKSQFKESTQDMQVLSSYLQKKKIQFISLNSQGQDLSTNLSQNKNNSQKKTNTFQFDQHGVKKTISSRYNQYTKSNSPKAPNKKSISPTTPPVPTFKKKINAVLK